MVAVYNYDARPSPNDRQAEVEYLVFTGVCLFFLHDISKTAAARITKHDTEMFHHESW